MKITGWDPTTGDLTYTYTLNTNDPTHGDPGTDTKIDETFPITATDKDGDTDTGDLEIGIVDDVPTAKNDSISIGSANNHTSTALENVEGNDVFGADGKIAGGGVVGVIAGSSGASSMAGVGTDIQGQYGKLHLNADGSYTYTRDNGDPLTAADKFTYTIKDGDGDSSTAVLTIDIKDSDVHILDLTPKADAAMSRWTRTISPRPVPARASRPAATARIRPPRAVISRSVRRMGCRPSPSTAPTRSSTTASSPRPASPPPSATRSM